MIFAHDLTTHAQDLNQSIAFECVGVQGMTKPGFFSSELANDLINPRLIRSACRRAAGFCFGIRLGLRHRRRQGRQNHQTEHESE